MSALLTRIEMQQGRRLTPVETFEITAARESGLSRLLMAYITTGLVFMLFPGTFLGVWNLLAISSRRAPGSVSAAWVQAHGHAQVFGWIGTFILGIGFYSIPKLRRLHWFALSAAWTSWVLWTSGVSLRWLTGVYQWQWRILLLVSAALELAAFLIFFRAVSGHRPEDSGKKRLEDWVFVVIAGAVGLMLTLLINLGAALWLAVAGSSPDLPADFDQRFLVLQTWGFLVPFVWGFSAKWLPVFLGLRPVHGRLLLIAVALNRRDDSVDRLDERRGGLADCGNDDSDFRASPVRVARAPCEGERRARELSVFRPPGLCLGDGCRDARNLGVTRGERSRNLGRIAPRPNRRFSGDHGICSRAARSTGVLWNAAAV